MTCLSSFYQLLVLISLNLYFFNSWQCAVAALGSKATVSVWGHVSGSPQGREDIREHDTVCLSFSDSQCCSCTAVTSWAGPSTSTFHSSNMTAAMRQDIAASVPSLHTTTCFLSEKSICSLAATYGLARVIPQSTSLQRTSGCTLHKLNLGLHLHRDRQCGFNP